MTLSNKPYFSSAVKAYCTLTLPYQVALYTLLYSFQLEQPIKVHTASGKHKPKQNQSQLAPT
jgi:hypothetical protein